MKKPWLAGLYRGLRYPLITIIINHDKDPYSTTRIQWKVMPSFFRGSLEFISYVLLKNKPVFGCWFFWQVTPPFNGKWWYIYPINTRKVYKGLIIDLPPSQRVFPPFSLLLKWLWRDVELPSVELVNHLYEANMKRLVPQPAQALLRIEEKERVSSGPKTRWWQLKYVLFSPLTLGKWSNLTHIFQMGWFNHQLEKNGGLWNSLGFSLVVSGIYLAYFSIGMVQPATSSLITAYFLGGCYPGGPSNAHVFFLGGWFVLMLFQMKKMTGRTFD